MNDSNNLRIAIFGASSQVGSSLALYLKKFTMHHVTCFVRSTYSDLFFEMLEIPYEQIDINNTELLKNKLTYFNVVVDFTYPAGQIYSIPQTIKKNNEIIISSMAADSIYIYMSSIMAFGTPENGKYIKNYLISRSSYGYIKRLAENLTVTYGKKYSIKTYNFRLGQVHGFLQSVNSSFREKLHEAEVAYIDGTPDEQTNTVFISSIANAIINCSSNLKPFKTYTLVSNPQWKLVELYNYYGEYYNIDTPIKFVPAITGKKTSIRNVIFKFLKSSRSFLETYILMKMPNLSLKVKGKYRQQSINAIANDIKPVKYIDFNLLGKVPSKTIDGIESEKNIIFNIEKECESYYNSIIKKNSIVSL